MKVKEIFSKKIINKKRSLIVLAVLVLVVVMIVSNPEVQEYLFGDQPVKISFQSGVEYQAFPYGNEMLLVSNEGIRSIDESGEDAWSVVHSMAMPMAVVNGDYIMVAETNGTAVNVYEDDSIATQIITKNEILTAKLNTDGYVAAATVETGYKGSVTVFDDDGKEIFKWYSGGGYIGDIDLSSDGVLAISQIMTDKESVYSKILLIDTENEKEARSIAELKGIAMKLRFNEGDELVAVTDGGCFCYEDDGEEIFAVDFGSRIPVDCNIENDDNLVFAFDGDLNNTVLESYSESGELRGSYEADSEIRAFDVNGEYILLATIDGVKRISPEGELEGEMTVSNDVKEIKIFPGRDRFMSLGGSTAEIIKID